MLAVSQRPFAAIFDDFEAAFGKPTKVINDAAMHALGSYEGGRMLFLGLGTGLGSAMGVDGVLEPMELAQLPFRNGTREDCVGSNGMKKAGLKRWRKTVREAIALQGADADAVTL